MRKRYKITVWEGNLLRTERCRKCKSKIFELDTTPADSVTARCVNCGAIEHYPAGGNWRAVEVR